MEGDAPQSPGVALQSLDALPQPDLRHVNAGVAVRGRHEAFVRGEHHEESGASGAAQLAF